MNGHSNGRTRPTVVLFTLAAACMVLLAGCDPIDNDSGTDDSSGSSGSSRIWGAGSPGLVNGSQSASRFNNPVNVEVAADGTVYVADFDNDAVRAIAPNGNVSTLAAMPANSRPFGLTIAADGFLYVQTDGNAAGQRDSAVGTGTLWRVNRTTGAVTQIATGLGRPRGLQGLPDGRIALSDPSRHDITIINPNTAAETLLAGANGTSGFVDATGAAARFNAPYGLALSSDGLSLLVADQNNHRIRQIVLASGVVTTFAGTGANGNTNGTTTAASFSFPQDVALAGANVYVADHDNFLIRRIKAGAVTTEAGSGTQGFADGTGTSASFFGLEGIAITADGTTLWIADGDNGDDLQFNRVRRLTVVP